MGAGRGLDSTLAAIARRRRTVLATRKQLNIGAESGAPQAPVRQNPPPQTLPARNPPQAPSPTGDAQERMLAQTKEFFQKVVRPQAVPIEQGTGIENATPQVPATPLGQQVDQMGATGLSLEQQFYRLAGRLPSPREMAVFRTTLLLEDQLGRRPTANELRSVLSRPSSLPAAFPSAVEA